MFDAMAIGTKAHQILEPRAMPVLHRSDMGFAVMHLDAGLADFAIDLHGIHFAPLAIKAAVLAAKMIALRRRQASCPLALQVSDQFGAAFAPGPFFVVDDDGFCGDGCRL